MIITRALTYAAMPFFFRNETGFGGNKGSTDFKRILSLPIATPCDAHDLVLADRFGAGRHLHMLRSAQEIVQSAMQTH